MEVIIIAAVASNGTIGDDSGLPWNIPTDLQHFRETTMGSPVIMGRVTYEGILETNGGHLEGRPNIVLTGNPDCLSEAVRHAQGLLDAFDMAEDLGDDEAFVIGGESVYEQAIDEADRMILTEIDEKFDGDSEFPEWPVGSDWEVVDRDPRERFDFVTYERCD